MEILENSKKYFEKENVEILFEKKIACTHEGKVQIWLITYNDEYYTLKQILKTFAMNNVNHVFNEKQALTELNHPLMIHLVKTLQDEEYLYMINDLAEGCTLNKIIQSFGALDIDFVRFLAYQIGLVLEYIHKEGFVYRDLKLSNIIINKTGKIKLIDFGFSKKIESSMTSSYCGTLHSMAPEFFYDKLQYQYEVDYYAYGILLFELASGKSPFGYGNANKNIIEDIKQGIQEEHLKSIKQKELKDLISQLTQKDPKDRLGNKKDDAKGFTSILMHEFYSNLKNKEQIKNALINSIELDSQILKNVNFEQYEEDIDIFGIFKTTEDQLTAEDQEKFNQLFK